MIFTPFCPLLVWWGSPVPFPTPVFGRWHRGFYIPAVNKQPTIWTVLVTTIMPASPNNQTPSPTTGIRLSSPFLEPCRLRGQTHPRPARRERQQRTRQHRSSSPLMRGTHAGGLPPPRGRPGLIPARAGNTGVFRLSGFSTWAHPARAGNTAPTGYLMACSAAHPRSRREHSTLSSQVMNWTGLSPLAQGTLPTPLGLPPPNELIPARAGNILLQLRRARLGRAHPRSRGEHRWVPPS